MNPRTVPSEVRSAIQASIDLLDCGQARVAEPKEGRWVVNEWLKKAVLLYFRTHDNVVMDAGYTRFYDKVPLKYAEATEAEAPTPDESPLRSARLRLSRNDMRPP